MQELRNGEHPEYQKRHPRKYTLEFKWQVVQEVLDGKFTKEEAQRVYGLGGKSAILNWMRKFNLVPSYAFSNKTFLIESPMKKNKEEIKKDQKIIELEKALNSEKNKSALFEKIIEIAEDKYGLEIRKKSGAKQYSNLNQKKVKK